MNAETKKLVKATGLIQKEIADKCEVTPQHLRAVLSGERESKSLLERIERLKKK